MEHITTLDGKLHIVGGDYDFTRLIEEYAGYDAGQKIQQLIDAADYTNQAIDTDLRAYESELAEFRSACNEILRLTDLIEAETLAKRMDRGQIKGVLQDIKAELENTL